MKILIIGASGSGSTTLAKKIGDQFSFSHLDVDDYYWKKTTPPYQKKVSPSLRRENHYKDFNASEDAIVSGSLVSWGNEWLTLFDLTVFIKIDPSIRMQRLKDREMERYGSQLQSNDLIKKQSADFLAWARQYDDPQFEGRSIKIQQDWINQLSGKILTIDGALPLREKMEIISNEIKCISK
ncbi:MAG: AAA family ATPase [Ekhidna sp.]